MKLPTSLNSPGSSSLVGEGSLGQALGATPLLRELNGHTIYFLCLTYFLQLFPNRVLLLVNQEFEMLDPEFQN